MHRFVVLGLLAMSSCVPAVSTNPIKLTPANAVAVRDGTPIGRLSGYTGDPRATVSFIFPDGETLIGDAVMTQDVENSMAIWGQTAQIVSSTSTVEMVAIDDRQKMDCRGTFNAQATNLTCSLTDGAVYLDDYVAPLPIPKAKAAQTTTSNKHSGH